MIGIFKTTTCGNNKEFIYSMDCEDGGWTNISNPMGRTFATSVDGNANIEFHMCVVKGANYGGFGLGLGGIDEVLLRDLIIVERYHDNEDSDTKNNVISDVKPDAGGFIGPSRFDANTLFSWVWDQSARTYYLGYPFGIIAQDGEVVISIDDENKKNTNWARYSEHPYNLNVMNWKEFPFKSDKWGMNNWENTSYKVKIKDL